ncbi:hypothetical protein [Neobacillus ginsengisoli]|uniref:Uncharacterized protein n=1 Tax=Neobacillus ginsengisoli TaxID=904295 RepID=A0ABT9XRN5_9BACI|nr:hypothetical protein [Neobacillus ginsengisoli]MDQ0197592.1 hypothetical protein [Neobacillus ginsengisoli]
MYRFSIMGEEWILRFSPHVLMDSDEKQEILMSLLHIGNDLSAFSHGAAFLMFSKKIGAIVFDVERIPSFILTVSNIIPEENWYNQNSPLKPLKKI